MGRINKERNAESFYPTDSKGRLLGWALNRETAKYMARTGYVESLDTINTLCLWPMWNDAIDSGEVPVEAEDGTQILQIFSELFMTVKQTETRNTVDIMNESRLYACYGDEEHEGVLRLKYTDKPIRLE